MSGAIHFFDTSDETPRPLEDVRITGVHVEVMPDNRRVLVSVDLTPFFEKPSFDVTLLRDGVEERAASVVGATGSIVNNAHLIKKVYFPRAVLPVSVVLSSMANFLIALPVFFALAWLSGVPLSGRLELTLLLPVVIGVQVLFTIGIGMILSTVNVFYRDTQIIMEVIMLAWFFLTPIVYPIETVPETATILGMTIDLRRLVFILNPMASIVASYRDVLYWGRTIGADFFLRTAVTSIAILVVGYGVFDRYSRRFAEEV